jgi:DNA-binding transcriptional MerR regulator
VQRALKLGFTLKELAGILKMRDSGGVPCHRVLKTTEQKLNSVERQIGELRQIQRYMRSLIREWRLKLAQTPPGRKALLLESLADRAPLRTRLRNNLKSE